MRRRLAGPRPALVLVAAVLALALSLPAGASAAYEPLGSSTTTLTIAKPFASFMKQAGVKLGAVAPATAKGAKLTLPLATGKWDPTTGKGQVESEGAIVFQSARKKLPFKDLTVKANSQPLSAKVGGGQLKVGSSKSIASKRAGFGSGFEAKSLLLSAKAATRLNKKLRPKLQFSAGQLIGTLKVSSAPAEMTVLDKGRMTLAFAPSFMAKLQGLFVSLNPISPAELSPGPVMSFPIATGSTISPEGTKGTIRTGGEVELLLLGTGQVFWDEQWLDLTGGSDLVEANLQPDPPNGGKQAQGGLFTLSLAGAQIVPDAKQRSVSVQGASLALTQTAADQLNKVLAQGKGVFSAGEGLGSVGFTAVGE
jgi:hypothetical protein